MKTSLSIGVCSILLIFAVSVAFAVSEVFKDNIFDPGQMKATDSVLKVKLGDALPDFSLPSLSRENISLSQFRGKKNVVISFVPAAWTPVCSDQWPGYNLAQELFEKNDAVLLGITVDSIPTLFAWTNQMGKLWFPVLSDFWPHGKVADMYGILRSDGVSERAILIVDKTGILRYVYVSDINKRPDLKDIATELEKLK